LARDTAVVLAVAWMVRALFILSMPTSVHSVDVGSWQHIADLLAQGTNPYQTTKLLNWPPVWMQLVFLLSKVAAGTGMALFRVLQLFLIAVESITVIALMRLVQQLAPGRNSRALVLLGIALNPVAILLVCQHGNFDVIVALWIVLFVGSLLRYYRSGDLVDWLLACAFLGFGILTKTIPLVLIPLLACAWRRIPRRGWWVGGLLLLGPVILGMSVIFVLSPAAVRANVISYRSGAGWFGISGLVTWMGLGHTAKYWSRVFYLLLLAGVSYTARLVARRPGPAERDRVLVAALLLVAVPTLGPGYAPQYAYWFLPLLVAVYAAFPGRLRLLLAGLASVAALTYMVEYSLFPSHGMALVHLTDASWVAGLSEAWSTRSGQTLVRLPLFVSLLLVLISGWRIVRQHERSACIHE
jgi:hypothetical protein